MDIHLFKSLADPPRHRSRESTPAGKCAFTCGSLCVGCCSVFAQERSTLQSNIDELHMEFMLMNFHSKTFSVGKGVRVILSNGP